MIKTLKIVIASVAKQSSLSLYTHNTQKSEKFPLSLGRAAAQRPSRPPTGRALFAPYRPVRDGRSWVWAKRVFRVLWWLEYKSYVYEIAAVTLRPPRKGKKEIKKK